MQIRLHVGRRAGEVVEVAPEAARAMLADGRATDIRAELYLSSREISPEVNLPRAGAPLTRLRRKANR